MLRPWKARGRQLGPEAIRALDACAWIGLYRRPHQRRSSHVGTSRKSPHSRLGTRRLHRGHLCGARHAGAAADPGHPARRTAHDHHRCRELSGLRRRHPGAVADGPDARPGRACRHRDRHRPHRRGRRDPAPVPADGRFGRHLHLRRAHHRHGRPGELAGAAQRGDVQGLRRVGLRHLRRVLLPRQEGRGGRRRQHGGGGSAVPDPLCQRR
jgi:hypothetical protein